MEYCGDGECNCGETCTSCPADCLCDTNPPVVTIEGVGKASDPNNWLNSGFEVKMTFTELNGGDSGLNTCQYKVVNFGVGRTTILWQSVTCNSLTNSTASITLTVGPGLTKDCHVEGSGGCRVYAKARDKIGNWSNDDEHFYFKDFKIDWTPPTTEIK